MIKLKTKNRKVIQRARRHGRIRSRIHGTAERPRLSVFKSNKFLYVQLIDDVTGKTLAAASTKDMKEKTMLAKAGGLGKKIAELGKGKKITTIVFDRGGYVYTGRVKAIADAAREGGLIF